MRMLTIGAFAKASRLSPKALRLHDELELLRPARVDPATGHRYRTAGQRARLRHGPAVAVEDLDFTAGTTRETHGRRKRFRHLAPGMPVARLRARLVAMATALGITVVAVDPACTSRWGARHRHQPLDTKNRRTTRHGAAAVAIGRRAPGHPIRRRTAPPLLTAVMAGAVPSRPDRRPRGVRGTAPASRTTDTVRAAETRSGRGRPGHPTPFGPSG